MEKLKRKIFGFAYGSALGDATRQQAFQGRESQLRDCKEAKVIVQEYMDNLLAGRAVDFYRTVQEVERAFQRYIHQHNIQGEFRFGNAQKLLNMTAKQLYIAVYADESLRAKFKDCHCPMDGVMVAHLIGKLDKAEGLPKRLADYTRERGWKGKLRGAWSRITFDDREQYEIFQEGIRFLANREGVSPIEYDYLVWGTPQDERV